MPIITKIDPTYDWWPDVSQTLRCRCGAIYRGRAKFTYNDKGDPMKLTDRPCPSCGGGDVIHSESDSETFILRG